MNETEAFTEYQTVTDEQVLTAADEILAENLPAFEELAK